MPQVREPAVAGQFYPSDRFTLQTTLESFLNDVVINDAPAPKALIVPHAGYIYSGPIAASAYARLRPLRNVIRRVILLGPAHRVGFRGLAVTDAQVFRTPLGDVPVDTETVNALTMLPQVHRFEEAHRLEHSLEVHLPFLQATLSAFVLVPLVVGKATAVEVDEVLEQVWGGPETLIVISSDLSHYQDYETARQQDNDTSHAIETLCIDAIDHHDACGRNPIIGLLQAARKHGLTVETVDLRNSGDTAGPRDHVVGYGAYVLR